jgi:hypothetical protein
VESVARAQQTRIKISRRLFEAVKLHPNPAYRIAQQAGLTPSTLSRLMHGYEPVREDDARVLAVAEVVGVPAARAFAKR